MTSAGLLNPKSAAFKKMGLDADNMSDYEAAEIIIANQKTLRRPLLTDGNKLVIGFDAEQYAALIR